MTLSRSLETQLLIRSDRTLGRSRTGKTKKKPKCNPGNKVCGSRCIPVEWDCREKGEGYDNHLKAKQTDLLGGLANIERGVGYVKRGVLKSSPAKVYTGRKAIIRGIVKLTPGTLSEKKEQEKQLTKRTHLIAGGLAVITLGLTGHALLKRNWRGYNDTIGLTIENSLRDGYSNFRDRLPVLGDRRIRIRAQARLAVLNGPRNALYRRATNSETLIGRIGTNSQFLAGQSNRRGRLNAVDIALRRADNSAKAGAVGGIVDYETWNTSSRQSFLGAQRPMGGGVNRPNTNPPGSAFSETAAERYISRQYGFTSTVGDTGTRRSALRTRMANSMREQSLALRADATARGFNINSRTLTTVERRAAREGYLNRIMRDNHRNLPPDVAEVTRTNLRTLLSATDATTFEGLANAQWNDTVRNFDNYYSELYTYSTTIPGAAAPRPNQRNRIPVEARDILAHADRGHAAALTHLLPPSSRVRRRAGTSIRGTSHAQLTKRHYYHTVVAGGPRSTYNVQPNLAITAAQELTGRTDINRAEAYRILREDFGYININPPSPPRARTPRRGDALPTRLGKSEARTDLRARTGKKGKKCGESYIPADHKCGPINGTSTKTKIGVAAAVAGGIALGVAAKKYKLGEYHTGAMARGLGQSDFVNPNFRTRRQSHIAKHGRTVTNQELIDQVSKLKGRPGAVDANIDRHIAFLKKTGLVNNPNLADNAIASSTKVLEKQALKQVKVAQAAGTMHGFTRLADDGQIYVRQTRRNLAKLDYDVADLEKHMDTILEDMDTPLKPFFTGSYAPNGDIQELLTTLHESGHKLHFKAGGTALPIKFADKINKQGISYDDLETALTKASTKYGMADIKGHYATMGNPNPRMETFAEMYTLYITSGKRFKAEHPLAYDWVDAIVDEAFEVQKW